MRVLIEAVGSPIWGPLLPRLREVADFIVGADVDPYAWGLYRVDRGALVPRYSEPGVWDTLSRLCEENHVDLVIPSINEGLEGWAARKGDFEKLGVRVLLSDLETIKICADKWETFQFFKRSGIPTAATSLGREHELLKPRVGRGGTGIRRATRNELDGFDMMGYVTQEFLDGQEYSIDAFCGMDGAPACVVVRERMAVESGVSVRGRVVAHPEIEREARRTLAAARFVGPVNMQCFITAKGVFFTEINPRIAGGLSLSMAATGNWFAWTRDMLFKGAAIPSCRVRTGLVMMRHYEDVIIHEDERIGRTH
jgi:carbamoyl-phosphate synthase large subunit